MPETETTETTETTFDADAAAESIQKLEGALEQKKGTVRELKGKLKAFESLGDPTEALAAVEFYQKHKDSDPSKVEERFRTLADQKLAEAKAAHEAQVVKLNAQILGLTKGRDGADALAAAGGVKEGYAEMLERYIDQHTAVREINGKPMTVVLDTDGEPLTAPGSLTPLPLATWVKDTLKPKFPDMFLGGNASGGGSNRTQDGSGGVGKWTREQWDSASPAAQSKFAAEGGELSG